MDFVYTIDANPEVWLIAGQRKSHFSAKEDEQHEYPIMLVPLKPGISLLPHVEIRAKVKPKEAGQGKATAGGDAGEAEVLSCETDYLSYGESIMIAPDVSSSTVGVGDMSLGGSKSVVWLESKGI